MVHVSTYLLTSIWECRTLTRLKNDARIGKKLATLVEKRVEKLSIVIGTNDRTSVVASGNEGTDGRWGSSSLL